MSSGLLEALLEQKEFSRKSRLPSLYSDFSRLAQANRDGYEANISAWIAGLNAATLAVCKNPLSITADAQLSQALTSKQYGQPLSLHIVEHEAYSRGSWIPLNVFINQVFPIATTPPRLSQLAGWLWSKVSSLPTRLSGTQYVILENVQARVQDMLQAHVSSGMYSDDIESLETYLPNDMILRKYLLRDVPNVQLSTTTIKFSSTPINQVDESIATLKRSISIVTQQRDTYLAQMASLQTLLASQISSSRKEQALSTLRRQKRVEANLAMVESRIDECTALLTQINESCAQIDVVNGMEAGSRALAELLTRIGGVERVQSVVDKVREQSDQVDEIAETMASTRLEEDDLEDEYRALLDAQQPLPDKLVVPQPVLPEPVEKKQGKEEPKKEQRVAMPAS